PEHRNNPNHSARSSDNIGRRRNPLPTAGPADQYGENMPELDPHTPVLVGVGQSSERLDDPEYREHSAVELATNAAHRAITDSGATGIATELDTIAGIRQFENSFPDTPAPLGKSDNYPRAVATRLGASPRRAILDVIGGQAPQHLVTEMAATIARGESDVA